MSFNIILTLIGSVAMFYSIVKAINVIKETNTSKKRIDLLMEKMLNK